MAIDVIECFDSRVTREGTDATIELHYKVLGTDDHGAARAAVTSTSPPIFDGLKRVSLDLKPEADYIWDAVVKYGKLEPLKKPETGEFSISFDTTGGSQRITQSLATRRYGSGPNFKGAIGVRDDTVEGVDIVVPSLQYTITAYKPASFVTESYIATLASLTGSVNNAPYKGFAAGELLFLGASGSKRSNEDWEISYKFSAMPNRANFMVGDINVELKRGWEYMWVLYKSEINNEDKKIIQTPQAVYVEQVYPVANFGLLGI